MNLGLCVFKLLTSSTPAAFLPKAASFLLIPLLLLLFEKQMDGI